MKRILIGLLLLILTACAAPSSEPAAPALVATVSEPLQDDTPSAVTITASLTPLPAATKEPSSPTPQIMCTPPSCQEGEIYYCSDDCPGGCGTMCATVTPIRPSAQSTATAVDVSGDATVETGEPVIVFNQTGGFAGVDLTWKIYANGLIVTPDSEELFVDPAVVDELLEIIEQTGFFEFVQPKPSNICCDFFTFTLAVTNGDLNNVITYNGGDTNIPAGIAEAVSAVQQLIAQ
jgi:hypothetical protein